MINELIKEGKGREPGNPSQPKPRPGQGNPKFNKSPHSATDLMLADLSRDT